MHCSQCVSAFPRRHCAQRGFANPLRFKFCGECGSGLSGQAERTQVIQPARTVRPQTSEPHANERDLPEAERRQLTVMF